MSEEHLSKYAAKKKRQAQEVNANPEPIQLPPTTGDIGADFAKIKDAVAELPLLIAEAQEKCNTLLDAQRDLQKSMDAVNRAVGMVRKIAEATKRPILQRISCERSEVKNYLAAVEGIAESIAGKADAALKAFAKIDILL